MKVMVVAYPLVNLQSLPSWVLWVVAVLGAGVLTGVLFWMMPPALRKGQGGLSVALAIGLFFVWTGTAKAPRPMLWLAAVGFAVAAVPLLWMGRLPADMPSARDPAVRAHPQYKNVARRGRIAGVAIVVFELTVIILSVIFVRGL